MKKKNVLTFFLSHVFPLSFLRPIFVVKRNRAQVSENPSDTVLCGSCTLQKMDLEFILLCEERQCEMKIHFILSWESFGRRLRPKDIRSQDKEGGRGGLTRKRERGWNIVPSWLTSWSISR